MQTIKLTTYLKYTEQSVCEQCQIQNLWKTFILGIDVYIYWRKYFQNLKLEHLSKISLMSFRKACMLVL